MEFLRANLWEVKKSTSLRLFGLILALGHVLIFVNWVWDGNLPLALANSKAQVCWPMFENCDFVRALSPSLLKFIYGCYLGFAIFDGAVDVEHAHCRRRMVLYAAHNIHAHHALLSRLQVVFQHYLLSPFV